MPKIPPAPWAESVLRAAPHVGDEIVRRLSRVGRAGNALDFAPCARRQRRKKRVARYVEIDFGGDHAVGARQCLFVDLRAADSARERLGIAQGKKVGAIRKSANATMEVRYAPASALSQYSISDGLKSALLRSFRRSASLQPTRFATSFQTRKYSSDENFRFSD